MLTEEQIEENKTQQLEESMALEAIYPSEFEAETESHDAFKYTLNLDQDDDDLRSPRTLTVRFFLPPTYPSHDLPVYEITSKYCGTKKINDDMMDAIDAGFQSLFEKGEVVLFGWIDWLREYLEENVEKASNIEEGEEAIVSKLEDVKIIQEEEEEEEEEFDYHPEDYVYKKPENNKTSEEEDDAHDRPTVRSLIGSTIYDHETPAAIFTSEALVDRKSIFVAHIAEVHSVHEVKVVVAHLLQNKKIAKATHNILAYRIVLNDNRILQDNDDDGESAAGGRLSHLLQIVDAENVVVVVTRWFGGIHLGPDRFKDINNCARGALEECGFIKDNSNSKKTKKQNNKK
ncbi:UPF0029-domain-containing protein [Backusella circina FSU 941]|nr:UPF0029-domain-containing protein [Backusella circina FSU 941]